MPAGLGFSLLSPTLLIDGLVEEMTLRLAKLPVIGLSRTLTVVARKGELRDLPKAVAAMSKQILMHRIAEHVGEGGTGGLEQI